MGAVHLIEQRETIGIGAAGGVGELVGSKEIRNRLRRVGFDDGALMHGGQEASGEAATAVVRQATCIRQHDEGGQVVGEIAERV